MLRTLLSHTAVSSSDALTTAPERMEAQSTGADVDAADMDADVDSRVKGAWSAAEDALLRKLVEENGPRQWAAIARGIKGRSSKSCRLRWCNHLHPMVNKAPFTRNEDRAIVLSYAAIGSRWSVMSKAMPGRTDSAIKNHWYATLKKRYPELLAGYLAKGPQVMPQLVQQLMAGALTNACNVPFAKPEQPLLTDKAQMPDPLHWEWLCANAVSAQNDTEDFSAWDPSGVVQNGGCNNDLQNIVQENYRRCSSTGDLSTLEESTDIGTLQRSQTAPILENTSFHTGNFNDPSDSHQNMPPAWTPVSNPSPPIETAATWMSANETSICHDLAASYHCNGNVHFSSPMSVSDERKSSRFETPIASAKRAKFSSDVNDVPMAEERKNMVIQDQDPVRAKLTKFLAEKPPGFLPTFEQLSSLIGNFNHMEPCTSLSPDILNETPSLEGLKKAVKIEQANEVLMGKNSVDVDILLNSLLASISEPFSGKEEPSFTIPTEQQWSKNVGDIQDYLDSTLPLEIGDGIDIHSMIAVLPQLHETFIPPSDNLLTDIPMQLASLPQPVEPSICDSHGSSHPSWVTIDNTYDSKQITDSTLHFSSETHGSCTGGDLLPISPLCLGVDSKDSVIYCQTADSLTQQQVNQPPAMSYFVNDELSPILFQEGTNICSADASDNYNAPAGFASSGTNSLYETTHQLTFPYTKNCNYAIEAPSSKLSPVSSYLLSLVAKNQAFTC